MIRLLYVNFFIFNLLVAGIASAKQCETELKLFGEISSFYPVPGKVPEKRSKFYPIEKKDLSAHMGKFKNIRIKSNQKLDRVHVDNFRVDLFESGGFFQSRGLNLYKVLLDKNKRKVFLSFRNKNRVICEEEYVGVSGD